MNHTASDAPKEPLRERVRWTTTDINLLPENEGTHYEIIDGELFTTRAPHWKHQFNSYRVVGWVEQRETQH
jgi:hypothetical protein